MSLSEELRKITGNAVNSIKEEEKKKEEAWRVEASRATDKRVALVAKAAENIGARYAALVKELLAEETLPKLLEEAAARREDSYVLRDVNFEWEDFNGRSFSRRKEVTIESVVVSLPSEKKRKVAVNRVVPVMNLIIEAFHKNLVVPTNFEGMLRVEVVNDPRIIEEDFFPASEDLPTGDMSEDRIGYDTYPWGPYAIHAENPGKPVARTSEVFPNRIRIKRHENDWKLKFSLVW